ncbi:MAG TPA: hypothetical protein VFZ47_03010, partial [Chitinophagaceae bacterium]
MNVQIISIILAVASFLALLIVGVRTDLLREAPGKPYSFRKFQLWIWSTIICPLFSLHWGFHSSDVPDLNQTSLILLGISGATTIVGEMISSTQVSGAAAGPLKALRIVAPASSNFWQEILQDDKGQISLVRLQQLIFTFIFIAVFIFLFFEKME